jgi:hypothetical protein
VVAVTRDPEKKLPSQQPATQATFQQTTELPQRSLPASANRIALFLLAQNREQVTSFDDVHHVCARLELPLDPRHAWFGRSLAQGTKEPSNSCANKGETRDAPSETSDVPTYVFLRMDSPR